MNQKALVTNFRGPMGSYAHAATKAFEEHVDSRFVSLETMNNRVKRDCSSKGSGRASVYAAIRFMLRAHRQVWAWSRSEQGWKLLDETALIGHCEESKRRTSRHAKRRLDKLETADFDKVKELGLEGRYEIQIIADRVIALTASNGFAKKAAPMIERMMPPESQDLIDLMTHKSELIRRNGK